MSRPYKFDLHGRLANRPYKSAISSNGVAGAAAKTVARNGLVPPLKMQSDVVFFFLSQYLFRSYKTWSF
jgi:hypothetical protein